MILVRKGGGGEEGGDYHEQLFQNIVNDIAYRLLAVRFSLEFSVVASKNNGARNIRPRGLRSHLTPIPSRCSNPYFCRPVLEFIKTPKLIFWCSPLARKSPNLFTHLK